MNNKQRNGLAMTETLIAAALLAALILEAALFAGRFMEIFKKRSLEKEAEKAADTIIGEFLEPHFYRAENVVVFTGADLSEIKKSRIYNTELLEIKKLCLLYGYNPKCISIKNENGALCPFLEDLYGDEEIKALDGEVFGNLYFEYDFYADKNFTVEIKAYSDSERTGLVYSDEYFLDLRQLNISDRECRVYDLEEGCEICVLIAERELPQS